MPPTQVCPRATGAQGRYLGVGSHDGVVAIVGAGGGLHVQRVRPVSFSPHPAVLVPLRNLLPVFEPVNLKRKGIEENGHRFL